MSRGATSGEIKGPDCANRPFSPITIASGAVAFIYNAAGVPAIVRFPAPSRRPCS